MSGEPARRPRPAPLAGVRRFFSVLRGRLLHNLTLKLAALLIAALFWVFVNTDETVVSQRTLRAPLNLEGLAPNQTVTGVPERVEVRLSGSPRRIAALNPEGVDAVLDLRGVVGEFEGVVRVFPPQGIGFVSVNPSEVLGTVELRVDKVVPVRALTLGAGPDDTLTRVRTSPGRVVVSGAETQVARVTQALVPVDLAAPPERGRAYPADAQGNPVAAVTLRAEEIGLELAQRPVLALRRLPLVLEPVQWGGAEGTATLTQDEITVVGPSATLDRLGRVTATLPKTGVLRPGQYTLDVTPALPEGVSALGTPQLSLRVRAPRPGRPVPDAAN